MLTIRTLLVYLASQPELDMDTLISVKVGENEDPTPVKSDMDIDDAGNLILSL